MQAVRDFCGFYGITWRRGITGIMSQRVVNHGQYADVRLSEKELDMADSFIKEQCGLDSDVYRWFWIGIESCARFDALYNMSLDYDVHTNAKTGKTTYITTIMSPLAYSIPFRIAELKPSLAFLCITEIE